MKHSLKNLLSDSLTENYVDDLINEDNMFRNLSDKLGRYTRGANRMVYGVHGEKIRKFVDKFPNFPYDENDKDFIETANYLKQLYADIVADRSIDIDNKNDFIDDLRSLLVSKIKNKKFHKLFKADEDTALTVERTSRFLSIKQEVTPGTRLAALEKLLNSFTDITSNSSEKKKVNSSEKTKGDDKGGTETGEEGKPEKSVPELSGDSDIKELFDEITDILIEDEFTEESAPKISKRILKRLIRMRGRGRFNQKVIDQKLKPLLSRADISEDAIQQIVDSIANHFDLDVEPSTNASKSDEEKAKSEPSTNASKSDEEKAKKIVKKIVKNPPLGDLGSIADDFATSMGDLNIYRPPSLALLKFVKDKEFLLESTTLKESDSSHETKNVYTGAAKSHPLFGELVKLIEDEYKEHKGIEIESRFVEKFLNYLIQNEKLSENKSTSGNLLIERWARIAGV